MLDINGSSQQTIEISLEDKLLALFKLQIADSKIDRIKRLRGELPLEVQDLEDEIAGYQTRVDNFKEEISAFEANVATKKEDIIQAEAKIKRYNEQQKEIRNNREFDALNKEIEFQQLEIQLCQKRIKEYTEAIEHKTNEIEKVSVFLNDRLKDLEEKKQELEEITSETQIEEQDLLNESTNLEAFIEPRLLAAYKRIRSNARNGLAVVAIERDACGGCFNKIPPQRQLEIKSRKKIIVCEYCGRILVDKAMINPDTEEVSE